MVDLAGKRVVATNRRALHQYEILETHEAGMVLSGSEVKSLRMGRISLQEGFARPERGELWLCNVHIPPYVHDTQGAAYDPTRSRKVLLHEGELKRLLGRLQSKGLTLVPLEIYFKRGWAKLSLALAKGKKGPDRRREIQRRDLNRELERDYKVRHKL